MRRSSGIRDVAHPRRAEAQPLDAGARAESEHGTDRCRPADAWIWAVELDRTPEQAQAPPRSACRWRRAGRCALGRRGLAYARILVPGAVRCWRVTAGCGCQADVEPRCTAGRANESGACSVGLRTDGAVKQSDRCDRCNRCGSSTRNSIFCRTHRFRRTEGAYRTCCTRRTISHGTFSRCGLERGHGDGR